MVNQGSMLGSLLIYMLPLLLLVGLFVMFSRMQGGARMGFGFGKSKAKQLTKDMPKTTFADVAGADEAVEELYEIKDFLQNPARYQALGAKIPKGVLLYGPPGTGKTLLARAVAGEAGVPFFTISGSDFVEMFVGVGASRVRDLFEQAKQNSPCIIFVDEIDAVGRQRGAGLGGGHDEREQTLNQLLVEMDGFGDARRRHPDRGHQPARHPRPGAAAARPVRPPDPGVQPRPRRPPRGAASALARASRSPPTPTSTGWPSAPSACPAPTWPTSSTRPRCSPPARTARVITGAALEEAVDRVVGGPRRKGRIISEQEKKITAYHEGGHTLAAWAMPDIEPVYKVTILARGRTGGHALAVPEDDKGLMTRSEMIARLVFAMGGRAAEELVFHEPTTGAVSDIEQATKIARAMVTEYGMSAKLGAVRYGREQGDPFLGRTMGNQPDYSLEVAREIDEEVRKLIEAAHTEAWEILNDYRDVLDDLAGELLEKETLHRADLERIFADVEKRPRITRSTTSAAARRRTSRRSRRPASWPSSAASRGRSRRPSRRSRPPSRRPSRDAAAPRPMDTHGANGQQRCAQAGDAPCRRATQPDYGAPAGWHAPGWPPRSSSRRSTGTRRTRRSRTATGRRRQQLAAARVSPPAQPYPPYQHPHRSARPGRRHRRR